ncbi:hypothetical protein GCM10023200_23410 [Actinomycetospora chlora]|uniref:Centromere-binding protein ParB C-terminal domain-containing protein n=1 Tax=Actinomycetospora chlora TaxID=663608 RepID=A0ABP9B0K7_9PSEU
MSSKAEALRRRMSIDPDAPAPAPRRATRRPTAAPTSEQAMPEPAVPTETAPEVEVPAAPAPGPEDTVPEGPAPDTPEPGPTDTGRRNPTPPPPARAAAAGGTSRPRSGSAAARGARRRSKPVADEQWATALDDPSIDPDGNGYRSFYVNDAVFARFRAAIFWTARRPDATGVPDNMSAGVEAFMDEVATDLERRYNDGAVFRPTPDQLRAHRKRST